MCTECLRADDLHWPACSKHRHVEPRPKTDRELAEWWLNESMDEGAIGHVHWREAPPALTRLLDSVRANEREECAKLCEYTMPNRTGWGGIGGADCGWRDEPNHISRACAANIRARRAP